MQSGSRATQDSWQTFVPWGICITATVIPAIKSPNMSLFQLYADSHPISGIELFKALSGSILLHLDDMLLKTAPMGHLYYYYLSPVFTFVTRDASL